MRSIHHALATALLLTAPFPAVSQDQVTPRLAPARGQAPGIFRMTLGAFEVTALSDGTVPQDMFEILTDIPPDEIERLLRRGFLTNPVEASINAYLIDTGAELILIDTGAGDLLAPSAGGRLVRNLAAAGVRPDEIDHVLVTHVHTDHSGGLMVGGEMVFANATIHAGQADLDFFLNPANIKTSGYPRRLFDEAQATVAPYVRANRVRGFTGPTELLPGISVLPTPGHTPGHSFFRVESQGHSMEFWGDIMHFGAIQFPRPETTVTYDVEPAAAAVQRQRQFSRGEQERRLVAFAHVNFPGIGHLRADGDGYIWEPVEYRDKPVASRP